MTKINYEKLKKVIDAWDPEKLLSYAPDNEYNIEIQAIYDLINENTDVESLALIIHKVFMEYFNEDFKMSKCIDVSRQVFED
ncbi:MAG: DUF1871 family protein [Marinisporobacter sp.]|jgi:hypothetical protein|nr:DUF1871 family protein [Marinisporobacter sp.]